MLAPAQRNVKLPYNERDPASGEDAIAYADFAATVQQGLEAAMTRLAEVARDLVRLPALVLAGGVAMNCSMIGALVRSGLFEEVYVPPVPTDVGVALGAALHAASAGEQFSPTASTTPTGRRRSMLRMPTPRSWGPGWPPSGCPTPSWPRRPRQRSRRAGSSDGAEVGERALGARSILADPRSRPMLARINTPKGREMWRPIAPSVLGEYLDEVLATPVGHPARFMLAAGTVRPALRTVVPVVTHVDGTARPQLVDRATNPVYWELIEQFRESTGIPLIVNTSFNLAGEPIVRTAADAVSTFTRCAGMDLLVLDNLLVARAAEDLDRALAGCVA